MLGSRSGPKPARCRDGPGEPPRLAPCAVPARLADAAVLLARLVAVHDHHKGITRDPRGVGQEDEGL
jgi:hypothetical protein